MGEIIFSVCIGGLLVGAGIILLIVLKHEEKRVCPKDDDGKK